jgi:hypothetical protein
MIIIKRAPEYTNHNNLQVTLYFVLSLIHVEQLEYVSVFCMNECTFTDSYLTIHQLEWRKKVLVFI